ncbi:MULTISPECIES: peptidoglycan-binding domain-containing protein [unclassified Streptomyces]|uniref:peptidoglycan-binding domain-containing protein n=1 Tax=unclassified Streptomyces TaxID=2593676 RepID=UPI0013A70110|nr:MULTISPECIES: peptidoglycan-binding domain-containing protein [unclassified Streptomyces]
MAKFCTTPRAAGAPRWAAAKVGTVVEWVVRQEYCFSKGGCNPYQRGGTGTDFFDERSDTTRCRFLASFLATRQQLDPADEGFISGSCEQRKKPVDSSDDENERFAVPDIITHEPDVRMEFYEIKPNSAEGREAARAKVETFLSLVDFLAVDRPDFKKYEKGTRFNPDRTITFYQRNYLGIVPCKASLHYRRATEPEIAEGVIVYEICAEVDGELLESFAKAIIVSAVIAALAALAAAAVIIFGGGVLGPAVLVFNSPMGGSVGPSGDNDPQDVRYVQALLNDWRASTGGSLIAIDGSFSEESAGALSDFQSVAGLEDTAGSLTPGDPTETELESTHLNNLMAAADLSEFRPEGLGDVVFGPDPDGVDTELEEEQDLQTAFNTFVQQYLQDLRNVV